MTFSEVHIQSFVQNSPKLFQSLVSREPRQWGFRTKDQPMITHFDWTQVYRTDLEDYDLTLFSHLCDFLLVF